MFCVSSVSSLLFSRAYRFFFHGWRSEYPFLGYAVSCAVAAFLGWVDAFV